MWLKNKDKEKAPPLERSWGKAGVYQIIVKFAIY